MGGQDESVLSGEERGHDEGAVELAVCLVSGGMDSCVTAAIAKEESEALAFLHVSYGQRTEARERLAFEKLADFYKTDQRLAVSIEHLSLYRWIILDRSKHSVFGKQNFNRPEYRPVTSLFAMQTF